ncbi:uracil-DNA glycosylase family protein [Agaribacter flavus]|uniref:Uracil-DNA glycosylase family protein n=1 Tax=Agaribacter flavus TaxID=1902781 RepID=A0ABV7FSV3_9ALTE
MQQYKTLCEAKTAISKCRHCEPDLPLGAKPIFQLHKDAKILIAGQAPGRITHQSGIPFDDPSGKRLREWLQVDEHKFYDPQSFAILPMAFCYPGKAASGDAPPNPACANLWRQPVLNLLPNIELTLLIGNYAQQWHCPNERATTLTERVKHWKTQWPTQLALPHPSPRNNIWLKKNPWFESDILPRLRARVREILSSD